MASTVQICNQALSKVGAARIIDLLDDTKNARILNAIFEVKRDAELAAHPWTFAIKRAKIPALSTAPAFGWLYSYPLPSDFLRLIEVGNETNLYDTDSGARFQVEGGSILCDEASPLQIRYVYRVTNTGLFSALFVEALACRLAAEIAEELTQNSGKRDMAWAEYKEAIKQARRVNAIEQPPNKQPDLSWVRAMTGA